MVAEDPSGHHQQVALLATANGTHIAVQVNRGLGGSLSQRKRKGGELDGHLEEKGIWLKMSEDKSLSDFIHILISGSLFTEVEW